MRLAVGAALCAWLGATLLLSRLRWFTRPSLSERIAPFLAQPTSRRDRLRIVSVASLRDLVVPLAELVGDRLARVAGVREDLATRLARIHSPSSPAAFRTRQLGAVVVALGIATLAAVALAPGLVLGVSFALGAPLVVFLLAEQRLASASSAWQQRLFLELPVVAEQLAMLLSAGYSLGGALNRLAGRSRGATGADLARVCARIRQGVPEARALGEWAALARVDALSRLVPVLALHTEASDLGRLVSDEARRIRLEVHRAQVVIMERRAQEVWIPVTVATLVPGVIFLAVPFAQALRLFSGG